MSAQAQEAPAPASETKVWLRLEEFDRLTTARGWGNDLARARALGVSHTTVGRLRDTDNPGHPGSKFIAATLAALGCPFDAVFERRPA